MRTYDLSPLWRSTIGFDHVFNLRPCGALVRRRPAISRPTISNALARTITGSPWRRPASRWWILRSRLSKTMSSKAASPRKASGNTSTGASRPVLLKRVFKLADHVQVTGASFENWVAQDRPCARGTGGDEATPHRYQRQRRPRSSIRKKPRNSAVLHEGRKARGPRSRAPFSLSESPHENSATAID